MAPAAVNQFQLIVREKERVSSVTSGPTHTVEVKEKEQEMEVTLQSAGPLDKDLVVLVTYKDPHQPWVVVEVGVKGSNSLMASTAVMVDFFPKFEVTQSACEYIFLVDRSGSMRGAYINSVRDMSRKFWSAEISVRRTKITGKIGPPGPNFPGKIGPTLEIMVRV